MPWRVPSESAVAGIRVSRWMSTVTLLEDLSRRDLTINAIAEDAQGRLIDPSGGQQDIAQGWLRHVSAAFVEDPLQYFVLRALRPNWLGFGFAPETQLLMNQICAQGELQTLSSERVWQELVKALAGPEPQRFSRCWKPAAACWLPECQDTNWDLAFDPRPDPMVRYAKLPLSKLRC